MAKAGAKKRVEDNRKRLNLLLQAIIFANVCHHQIYHICVLAPSILILKQIPSHGLRLQVVHVVFRMFMFRAGISWAHWMGFVLTSSIYLVCYRGLAQAAGL